MAGRRIPGGVISNPSKLRRSQNLCNNPLHNCRGTHVDPLRDKLLDRDQRRWYAHESLERS